METEKQYRGLVLVISLVGCVQLQAAGGGWDFDTCVDTGDMVAGGRSKGMPVSQFSTDNSNKSDDALGQFQSPSQSPFMCKEGMVQAAAAKKSQSPTSTSSAADASSLFFPNQATADAAQQQQGQKQMMLLPNQETGLDEVFLVTGEGTDQRKIKLYVKHPDGQKEYTPAGQALCVDDQINCGCSNTASPDLLIDMNDYVIRDFSNLDKDSINWNQGTMETIFNDEKTQSETWMVFAEGKYRILIDFVNNNANHTFTEEGNYFFSISELARKQQQQPQLPASDHTLGSQSSVGSDLPAGSSTKHCFDNPAHTQGSSRIDSPTVEMVAPAPSGADSVQGQQQASDVVAAAAAALLGGLSSQGAGNQEQLGRIDTPAPSQPGSLQVSGKGSRATSAAQLPSLDEEGEQGQSARNLFGGVSQEQAEALLDPVKVELKDTKAAVKKLQEVFEGVTTEQLPTLVSALTEMTDANNALNEKREEKEKALEVLIAELQNKVAQLQAAQPEQPKLLDVTRQSRELAVGNSRRRGFIGSVLGFCMNRQPERGAGQHDQSHTPPHQMGSLHSLSSANDASKPEGPGTLARKPSGRSSRSQTSKV